MGAMEDQRTQMLKAKSRQRYIDNREEIKAKSNAYYHANKDRAREYYKANKDAQYATNLRNNMLISKDQIDAHIAETHCQVCGVDLANKKRCADHSYQSRMFRGTLCNRCNSYVIKKVDAMQNPHQIKAFVEKEGLDHKTVVGYLNFC